MRIVTLQTTMVNANYRNYLFVELTTDSGLVGVGEATLEWQERAVEVLLHDWVAERVVGTDPRDLHETAEMLIRDQYQGGSTIMTAISAVEVALWDIVGKQNGQPVYELLGGQVHDRLPAYANGWYGGQHEPRQYAKKAVEAVRRGYRGLKVDPFGVSWKQMTETEIASATAIVSAIRDAVGSDIDIMIEVHGRLAVDSAIEMAARLEEYRPVWYEEPVISSDLDGLKRVRDEISIPVAAGERLYGAHEFTRLIEDGCVDVVQMDPSHCGGLSVSREIAASAEAMGVRVSPHCSIGPVALAAALHLDWATQNVTVQENFSEFDVPWRDAVVGNWSPCVNGYFALPATPGLGVEIDKSICAEHPYKKYAFPSLWDAGWVSDFTQREVSDDE